MSNKNMDDPSFWARLGGYTSDEEKSDWVKARDENFKRNEEIKRELGLMDLRFQMERNGKVPQKGVPRKLTQEQLERRRLNRELRRKADPGERPRTRLSTGGKNLVNYRDDIDELEKSYRTYTPRTFVPKSTRTPKAPSKPPCKLKEYIMQFDWEAFGVGRYDIELPVFRDTGKQLLEDLEARYAEQKAEVEEEKPEKEETGAPPTSRWILPVEQVTRQMLESIHVTGKPKTYDQRHGSSCHECRQKSVDQKTFCRNPKCRGVRGQFCGNCLMHRYGQDPAKALLNPSWWCPVCRNLCVCSFCRSKKGLPPTKMLFPTAREMGYLSVWHMLEDLKEKKKASQKKLALGSLTSHDHQRTPEVVGLSTPDLSSSSSQVAFFEILALKPNLLTKTDNLAASQAAASPTAELQQLSESSHKASFETLALKPTLETATTQRNSAQYLVSEVRSYIDCASDLRTPSVSTCASTSYSQAAASTTAEPQQLTKVARQDSSDLSTSVTPTVTVRPQRTIKRKSSYSPSDDQKKRSRK